MKLLFMLIFISSVIFMFLTHPLSLGLILLIQTTLIAIITGSMTYNYWFSYIIFLIMIGGMLILFIYMTSVASNEKFNLSFKIISFLTIMMIPCLIMFLLDNYFFSLQLNLPELMSQLFLPYYKMTFNKFLNWNSINIFFMIIIYLLITLIMVVKITSIQYGPLRQKF